MILTDGTTAITLPDDLDWEDEFSWTPVSQSSEYSVSGALIVQHATRSAGRPITLVGGENRAWVPLDVVSQLDAWSHIPGQALSLTLRGTPRSVIFRHGQGAPFEAREIFGRVPGPEQNFAITARFFEI